MNTAATLALVRDESTPLDIVARTLNVTPHHAAGLIDAITGTREFADNLDWWEQSEFVKSEYRAGYDRGNTLANAERHGEPATFDVPEFNPCPACDVPF